MFIINIFEYNVCLVNKSAFVALPAITVNSKGVVVLLIAAFQSSLVSNNAVTLWNVAGIAGLDFLVSKCKK